MPRRPDPDRALAGLRTARVDLRTARRTHTAPARPLALVPLLALGVLGSLLPGPWRWIAGFGSGLVVALWLALDDRLRCIDRWRTEHVDDGCAHPVLDARPARALADERIGAVAARHAPAELLPAVVVTAGRPRALSG